MGRICGVRYWDGRDALIHMQSFIKICSSYIHKCVGRGSSRQHGNLTNHDEIGQDGDDRVHVTLDGGTASVMKLPPAENAGNFTASETLRV
jgi:hypothetical protein